MAIATSARSGEVDAVRRQGHAPTLEATALPLIFDHRVMQNEREAL
jgi:hypothetical protein